MENNELWRRISQVSDKTESVIRGMKIEEKESVTVFSGEAAKDPVDLVISRAFEKVKLGMIDISRVQSFMDYPFDTGSTGEMAELAADIKKNGLERPVVVRQINDEKYDYEMIDGHRRAFALRRSGGGLADAYILDCSDEAAAVILCEYNLRTRKEMKLSEQSRVYGMELEALKHLIRSGELPARSQEEGLQAGDSQVRGEKTTRAMLAARHGLSAVNMSRLIRLRELIPDLLDAADARKIPFNVAVALTHLREPEQEIVYRLIDSGARLSLTDAERLKKQVQSRLEPMKENEIKNLLGMQTESCTADQIINAACSIACSTLKASGPEAAGAIYTSEDADRLAELILQAVRDL